MKQKIIVFLYEGLLCCLALLFIGLIAYLIYCPPAWLLQNKHYNIELIRILIFTLGALGGLYGLIIANKRQKKFEEQVETGQQQVGIGQKQVENAQAQLFNDRLRYCVELLDNEKSFPQMAGVRLLDDLAKTSDDNQTGMILKILYSYVNNRGQIKYQMKDGKYLLDDAEQKIPESLVMGEQRQSVELALRAILTHAHKNNVKRDDIIFENLDIRGFNLSNITCRLTGIIFHGALADEVNFRETTLENAHFIGGNFYKARFHKAILNGTEFSRNTDLSNSDFTEAELNRAIFFSCELYMAFFNRAELKQARIYIPRTGNGTERIDTSRYIEFSNAKMQGADLSHSKFDTSNFNGAELDCANFTAADLNSDIVTSYSGNSEEKKDIRGAKNITQEQFDLLFIKKVSPQ
ncbi:MAG: pentapeptide repeat-containing protein [Alphaproteobacteria bacterium]|nr:pentapeptide repeat-containing protein [Alphaproteobacteria bacterium]MBL6776826.1 pentapeptide repeat-containing protein [Alphaproteobacteria bacterium]